MIKNFPPGLWVFYWLIHQSVQGSRQRREWQKTNSSPKQPEQFNARHRLRTLGVWANFLIYFSGSAVYFHTPGGSRRGHRASMDKDKTGQSHGSWDIPPDVWGRTRDPDKRALPNGGLRTGRRKSGHRESRGHALRSGQPASPSCELERVIYFSESLSFPSYIKKMCLVTGYLHSTYCLTRACSNHFLLFFFNWSIVNL